MVTRGKPFPTYVGEQPPIGTPAADDRLIWRDSSGNESASETSAAFDARLAGQYLSLTDASTDYAAAIPVGGKLRWSLGSWYGASGAFGLTRVANGRWAGMAFADGATVTITAPLPPLPAEFATFDIEIEWVAEVATTNNVVWFAERHVAADGGSLNVAPGSVGVATAASAGQYLRNRTTVASGLALAPTSIQYFRLGRAGADGADTLAGQASVLAINIVRAS